MDKNKRYGGIILCMVLFAAVGVLSPAVIEMTKDASFDTRAGLPSILRIVLVYGCMIGVGVMMKPKNDDRTFMWLAIAALMSVFAGPLIVGYASLAVPITINTFIVGELIGAAVAITLSGIAFNVEHNRVVKQDEQPKAPEEPKKSPHADLDRERADLLKELELAGNDKDNPLDPMVVEAQRQEIEANYQRKLAERNP